MIPKRFKTTNGERVSGLELESRGNWGWVLWELGLFTLPKSSFWGWGWGWGLGPADRFPLLASRLREPGLMQRRGIGPKPSKLFMNFDLLK